jgi:chromosome segregation ATPase
MAINGVTRRGIERQQPPQIPALTSEIVREHGWQRQAEHLSLAHAAVGLAAMVTTGRPRRRTSLKLLPTNISPVEEEFAEPLKQNARERRSGRTAGAHKETSTALTKGMAEAAPAGRLCSFTDQRSIRDNGIRQWRTSLDSIVDETVYLTGLLTDKGAAAAEQRISELKGELQTLQEERTHWENEACSLQGSLDLLISENARLSRCLAESAAAAQQKKAALIAADAELNKLDFAFNDANERRQTEVDTLHNRLQAVSASTVIAEKRVAELEGELGEMRRKLVLTEDENRSLQASLAGAYETRCQLEQKKAALIAADVELNKLVIVFNDTNEKRQTEINTLHNRLQDVSARAGTAERLLAEARHSWLLQIQEYSTAESRLAEASAAWEAANLKLELLENSLRLKESQLQELKESSSKLIEGTLKGFNALDTALACDQRIKFLTQRVAQLETEASYRAEAQQECNNSLRQDARNSAEVPACSTGTLLASTITF